MPYTPGKSVTQAKKGKILRNFSGHLSIKGEMPREAASAGDRCGEASPAPGGKRGGFQGSAPAGRISGRRGDPGDRVKAVACSPSAPRGPMLPSDSCRGRELDGGARSPRWSAERASSGCAPEPEEEPGARLCGRRGKGIPRSAKSAGAVTGSSSGEWNRAAPCRRTCGVGER